MPILYLIPCHNEELHVRGTVTSILKQDTRTRKQILLCASACTDNTEKILRDLSRKHRNVNYIIEKRPGKAVALNSLLDCTKKYKGVKYLVFVDGDVILDIDATKHLVSALEKEKVKAVGAASRGLREYATLKEELLHHMSVLPIESDKYKFLRGGCWATATETMKNVRFPENIILDDIWISLHFGAENIRINDNAIVRFHVVKSFSDFSKQTTRHIVGLYQINNLFAKEEIRKIIPSLIAGSVADFLRGKKGKWKTLSARQKAALVLAVPAYSLLKAKAKIKYKLRRPDGTWRQVGSTKRILST